MTSKMIFVTFVAIFFVGCAGNTPSVTSNVSADKSDNFIDNPYPTWKKEQEGADKWEKTTIEINKEIDDILNKVNGTND